MTSVFEPSGRRGRRLTHCRSRPAGMHCVAGGVTDGVTDASRRHAWRQPVASQMAAMPDSLGQIDE